MREMSNERTCHDRHAADLRLLQRHGMDTWMACRYDIAGLRGLSSTPDRCAFASDPRHFSTAHALAFKDDVPQNLLSILQAEAPRRGGCGAG